MMRQLLHLFYETKTLVNPSIFPCFKSKNALYPVTGAGGQAMTVYAAHKRVSGSPQNGSTGLTPVKDPVPVSFPSAASTVALVAV